jgi:hypothetical protein
MNRIRAAYMEVAPELERYFVMGRTDDERGVNVTMGLQPGTSMAVQMLASTPLLVTVLNGIIVAAIVALLVLQLGGATLVALAMGAIGFVTFLGGFSWYARRDIGRVVAAHQPLFPGRDEGETGRP